MYETDWIKNTLTSEKHTLNVKQCLRIKILLAYKSFVNKK